MPYYLPIAGGRIFGFIPFPRVLVLCEMQSVRSRIWTRVVVSLSCDDNHYTSGTSNLTLVILFIRIDLNVLVMKECSINFRTGSSPLDAVYYHTQNTESIIFLNTFDLKIPLSTTFKRKIPNHDCSATRLPSWCWVGIGMGRQQEKYATWSLWHTSEGPKFDIEKQHEHFVIFFFLRFSIPTT